MTDLPELALSVRQPWAWAIIFGGKDVENRVATAIAKGNMHRARIAVHASAGMTRDEYESARDYMAGIGVTCPPAIELQRGGIIGAVDVVDIVDKRRGFHSRWFFGPYGLVLRNPEPCAFVPATGALGYFRWRDRAAYSKAPEPAAWMRPKAAKQPQPELEDSQGVLL